MHKPDLSGEWTLNREASQLSPEVAPVVESGFVRVTTSIRRSQCTSASR